jgi:hypothetical protein
VKTNLYQTSRICVPPPQLGFAALSVAFKLELDTGVADGAINMAFAQLSLAGACEKAPEAPKNNSANVK